MTLLLGDETEYDWDGSQRLGFGDLTAFQFTAVATGTIDTIEIRANDDVLYFSNVVDVRLAVFSDSTDAPGVQIGNEVTWSGVPVVGDWLGGSGAAASVVSGVKYWLTVMAGGGTGDGSSGFVFINVPHSDGTGGTRVSYNGDETYDTIPDTWPTSDTNFADNAGPVQFRALGDLGGGPTPITGLVWQVTGLWYPDATTVDEYGTIADPDSGEVVIPLNDSRTAKVTLSVNDPLAASVVGHAYARALKCYYHGTLIFWGIISLPEVDMDAGTVTLNAVDPSIRAIRHYLRRGDLDGDLSAPNDRANVTIDHLGLRLVLDAARNIPGQTTRGCPDIGINVGTNDFVADPTSLMGVSRGDPVWDTILQLSQTLGPDFELEPLDNTVGAYCKLNTYIRQGTDRSATVQLHYGTGLDNLDNLAFTEGSQYVTHVHVLSRDLTYRFTRVNVEASAETGQYTIWDATDYDSHGIAAADVETVLDAYGDDVLKAYGRPLIAVTLTMPVETDGSWRYLTDYAAGDTIGVAGLAGHVELPASDYRITKVTLTQAGEANGVQPSVEVVADRAADDTITGDE